MGERDGKVDMASLEGDHSIWARSIGLGEVCIAMVFGGTSCMVWCTIICRYPILDEKLQCNTVGLIKSYSILQKKLVTGHYARTNPSGARGTKFGLQPRTNKKRRANSSARKRSTHGGRSKPVKHRNLSDIMVRKVRRSMKLRVRSRIGGSVKKIRTNISNADPIKESIRSTNINRS